MKNEEKPQQKEEEEKKTEEICDQNHFEAEESELPFRVIENKKLDVVPYLDKDLYLLYEPNYKKHNVNFKVCKLFNYF